MAMLFVVPVTFARGRYEVEVKALEPSPREEEENPSVMVEGEVEVEIVIPVEVAIRNVVSVRPAMVVVVKEPPEGVTHVTPPVAVIVVGLGFPYR